MTNWLSTHLRLRDNLIGHKIKQPDCCHVWTLLNWHQFIRTELIFWPCVYVLLSNFNLECDLLAVVLQQLAHIHNKTVHSCPFTCRKWSCSINKRGISRKTLPPLAAPQHSTSRKLSPLRLSTSGLGLRGWHRLELFIGHARLLDSLSSGRYQQEWHDIHYREQPGPLQ